MFNLAESMEICIKSTSNNHKIAIRGMATLLHTSGMPQEAFEIASQGKADRDYWKIFPISCRHLFPHLLKQAVVLLERYQGIKELFQCIWVSLKNQPKEIQQKWLSGVLEKSSTSCCEGALKAFSLYYAVNNRQQNLAMDYLNRHVQNSGEAKAQELGTSLKLWLAQISKEDKLQHVWQDFFIF